MCSYLYELPTTGALAFSEYLIDKSASYIAEVSDTTEARANLRAALKENKRSDEKDYLRLVKVRFAQVYQLEREIHHSLSRTPTHRTTHATYSAVFSWRTTLSSTLFHNSPRLSFPSLDAEVAFTLLTYGFALSNLARAVVVSLGTYETERGLSDADRRAKDDRLGFAVTLLCKTAGVFEYIAKEVLSGWVAARERALAAGLSCPHPPDLSREVLIGLSKMALADAQNLAIRKLLTRAAMESVVTPGPPLPRSHPSPALAAKLHLECVALYTSARALVKTPGASRPALASHSSKSKFKLSIGKKDSDREGLGATEPGEEVAPELRRYLNDEVALHNALSHKWLGVDAGENGGSQQTGTAVGFLGWSKRELEDLKGGGSGMAAVGIASEREKDMRDTRRTRVHAELDGVSVFLKGYKRMNDSMSFQVVPPQSDLQAAIPAGRAAVSIRPYAKPTPAFGPGSPSYLQQMAEELERVQMEATTGETSLTSPSRTQATYAGAGAYF
ncbi:hypothetical protein EIP86_008829 [Pleurotus ostreatoroseus]|nr:hypothetical protein EIP86_008829 [Pleurotus ostreatoroseus]